MEDIVGGHSAAANFLVKVIAFIAQYPQVQKNIQAEVDNLLNSRDEKTILIGDRNKLIYTEATIMESLRMISSPIVPHVASQDSTIDGKCVREILSQKMVHFRVKNGRGENLLSIFLHHFFTPLNHMHI